MSWILSTFSESASLYSAPSSTDSENLVGLMSRWRLPEGVEDVEHSIDLVCNRIHQLEPDSLRYVRFGHISRLHGRHSSERPLPVLLVDTHQPQLLADADVAARSGPEWSLSRILSTTRAKFHWASVADGLARCQVTQEIAMAAREDCMGMLRSVSTTPCVAELASQLTAPVRFGTP